MQLEGDRHRCPASLSVELNGITVATARIERTVPAMFTFSATFDVGKDLGSPVSLQYADRKPFTFTGTVTSVQCRYLPSGAWVG